MSAFQASRVCGGGEGARAHEINADRRNVAFRVSVILRGVSMAQCSVHKILYRPC